MEKRICDYKPGTILRVPRMGLGGEPWTQYLLCGVSGQSVDIFSGQLLKNATEVLQGAKEVCIRQLVDRQLEEEPDWSAWIEEG